MIKNSNRVLAMVLALIMALSMLSVAASAYTPGKATTHTVFKHTTQTLAPGVEYYKNYANSNLDGEQLVYFVTTADVSRDDVIVQTSYKDQFRDGVLGYSRLTDQIASANEYYSDPSSPQFISENYNVVSACNASFYNMTTDQPIGVCYIDGVDFGTNAYPVFFAILEDGTAVIDDRANKDNYNIWQAVGGSQWLVRNGQDVTSTNEDQLTNRFARTAVGVTAEGKVVLMTLDGRQAPYSIGGSMHAIAQIMLEADCVAAINLDGGGSATFVVKEEGADSVSIVNRPSDGSERPISTGIIIASTTANSSTTNTNQKSIAVFSTEKTLSIEKGDSMWLAFGLMDDTTQTIDEQWKKMAITSSDSTVVSLSDYFETEYGYSLELTGLKQGTSHLTITDTQTGINTIISVSVYDQYVKSYSYAIDNIPTFNPNNIYENHIATNIYDLNGLYVNNYKCKTTNIGYDVSFDVYNSRYYSGAVEVFDATGVLINYEEIEKFSDISSLWDTGVQAYYLISDVITQNVFTYQQASFSKCTHFNISVPVDGYFTITNNISESSSVLLLNSLEILFDTTCDFFDLAISGSDKVTAFEGFKSSVKELTLKEIREGSMEIALNSLRKETKDIMKKLIETDFKNKVLMSKEVYSDMSTLTESILNSYNIDWKHLFKSATGVGETLFSKFAGPAGVALKGCFAITKGSNKLLRAIQMSVSCDNTYATIYSNKNECNVNQHGVVVNTQGNVDAEAVLQVFKVSNDDTVVSTIDNSFDNYELYNICFVKNDQLVQPNGKVTVQIPIPQGMKGNTCKVYRKENEMEWTILNAHVEGNYLVFETEHFSLYTVVGERNNLTVVNTPLKAEYYQGEKLIPDGLTLEMDGDIITSGYICNPSVLYENGIQTITVYYGNLETEFSVVVNPLIPGDINDDGKVNNKDVTRLMQYLAHWEVEVNEDVLDTNGDGKVNNKDVTRFMQYLAHWDVVLNPVIAATYS